MQTCSAAVSVGALLNERLAREISDALADESPIVVIVDKDGRFRPSDAERFDQLNLDASLFELLKERVDDGAEPVCLRHGAMDVALAQLRTEQTDCGYIMLVVTQPKTDSPIPNMTLVETLLHQVSLAAQLLEQNHRSGDRHQISERLSQSLHSFN